MEQPDSETPEVSLEGTSGLEKTADPLDTAETKEVDPLDVATTQPPDDVETATPEPSGVKE
jgi:hypothetical protein